MRGLTASFRALHVWHVVVFLIFIAFILGDCTTTAEEALKGGLLGLELGFRPFDRHQMMLSSGDDIRGHLGLRRLQ